MIISGGRPEGCSIRNMSKTETIKRESRTAFENRCTAEETENISSVSNAVYQSVLFRASRKILLVWEGKTGDYELFIQEAVGRNAERSRFCIVQFAISP